LNRKDPKHLKFVASLPCAICGGESQAHHLLRDPDNVHKQYGFKVFKGMGIKSPDMFAIPLCVKHHTELHMNGDEVDYLAGHGINGVELGLRIWNLSLQAQK